MRSNVLTFLLRVQLWRGLLLCANGGTPPLQLFTGSPHASVTFSDRLRKPSRAAQSAVSPLPNYYFLFLSSLYKQCFLLSILPGSCPTPSSVYTVFFSSFKSFLKQFLPCLFFPFSYTNLLPLRTFVPLSCHVHFPHLTSSSPACLYSPIPSITYPLISSPLVIFPQKRKEGGGRRDEAGSKGHRWMSVNFF